MKLYPLFSTKQRERILGYLLEHPSEKIRINSLAKKLRLSAGEIHKYAAILKRSRLVSRAFLKDAPLTRQLRRLWNVKKLSASNLPKLARFHFPNATGIGIYGSWSEGTNNEKSDLDIWVNVLEEPDERRVAHARREISKKLKTTIDLTILTPARLEDIRKKSDAFYYSLYHGLLLWGEGI